MNQKDIFSDSFSFSETNTIIQSSRQARERVDHVDWSHQLNQNLATNTQQTPDNDILWNNCQQYFPSFAIFNLICFVMFLRITKMFFQLWVRTLAFRFHRRSKATSNNLEKFKVVIKVRRSIF